jgi:hypothetical protein
MFGSPRQPPRMGVSLRAPVSLLVFVAIVAAAERISLSPEASAFGTVALHSTSFVALGNLRTPAVVNFALEAGAFRIDDIFSVCEPGINTPLDGRDSDTIVNACNGAEFFLRVSPGLENHVKLIIVKDESSLRDFRGAGAAIAAGHDGWAGAGGHGVAKLCARWTLDECFVNREMTYTSSYKDTRPPLFAGPIEIVQPVKPEPVSQVATTTATEQHRPAVNIANADAVGSGSNDSNGATADVKTGNTSKTSLPLGPVTTAAEERTYYRVLSELPGGVEFNSRMAGSVYRLHINAQHFLVEVNVPEHLAGHAFLQLEIRLTGRNSMTFGFVGLLATAAFIVGLGALLMSAKKYGLRVNPYAEQLTPQDVYTIGGRPGGVVGAAVAPHLQLPEIVGKPITPARLVPPKKKSKEPQQQQQQVSANNTAAPPAAPNLDVRPDDDDTHAGSTEVTMPADANYHAGAGGGDEGRASGGWAALVDALRLRIAPGPRRDHAATSPRSQLGPQPDAELDAMASTRRAERVALTAPDATSAEATADTTKPADHNADNAAVGSPAVVLSPLPPVSLKVPVASDDDDDDVLCRICQEPSPRAELFAPCQCAGTSKYVHKCCLEQWRHATTNPHHRDACAECKKPYLRKAELIDQERRARRRKLVPMMVSIGWYLFLAVRPISVILATFLVGGYAVKLGAFFLTLDTGVDWSPDLYHMLTGFAVFVSIGMIVGQLAHFFSGMNIWLARGFLWSLGFFLPFAFGFIAMFLIWLAEIVLWRYEVSYVAGVVCEFVAAQYFLPTLNEYAQRAELRIWLERDARQREELRATRELQEQALEAMNPAGQAAAPPATPPSPPPAVLTAPHQAPLAPEATAIQMHDDAPAPSRPASGAAEDDIAATQAPTEQQQQQPVDEATAVTIPREQSSLEDRTE